MAHPIDLQQEAARRRRLVSFPDLSERFGIRFCRMHIDRLEKVGAFPKRLRLGANAVCWVEAEIEEWLDQRIAARDPAPGDAPGQAA